ncbi:la-related protein 7-like isoform X1 [Haliotis asinina]|uniref:la-related protein 7-like isoform X1 n=2 Tax=Haliotis asinina TaxID=109174 RepID=UPI0035321FFA
MDLKVMPLSAEDGNDPDAAAAKTKKPRKRMKEMRKKIQSQMEFYFSDSNLQKDRFLKKEIGKTEDGYIDITIFLKFNKIRQLTDDIKTIARSLKKSKLLEVNNSETKVKRIQPIQSVPDVDDRTVYVENLPRTIDHEWVRSLFSQCGNVQYVSLPRFKSTGDLKGFGFVEFASKQEATKACEMLHNPPPMSGKAGRFPKWNKMLYQLKKKSGQDSHEDMDTTDKSKENDEPVQKQCKKHKKRRRHTSESSIDCSSDSVPAKKRKTESSDGREETEKKKEVCKDMGKGSCTKEQGKLDESVSDGLKSEEDDRKEGKKKKKRKKQRLSDSNKSLEEDSEHTDSSFVEKEKSERGKRKRTSDSRESCEFSAPQAKVSKPDDSGVDAETGDVNTNKKRTRRKTKKKKNKEKDIPPPQLKVITKQEWLKLREEYLSQQKANMAALKQSLRKQRQEMEEQKNKMEEGGVTKGAARPDIEYVPGVIVQVTCSDPMNRRTLKEKLPREVGVAYFDIKDNALSGNIRCNDEESARKISEFLLENHTFNLLTGDHEKRYWEKLKADREEKFRKKTRTKKRGTQKLIEKAHKHNAEMIERNKHIVFED